MSIPSSAATVISLIVVLVLSSTFPFKVSGFVPVRVGNVERSVIEQTSALQYQAGEEVGKSGETTVIKKTCMRPIVVKDQVMVPPARIKTTAHSEGKKPTIIDIMTLDDLKYFLEDDDRVAVIKFFAPWCKSCRKLDRHFVKLAREIGDGVENRQKVQGHVRFGQVAYSKETACFLTETLRIRSVPTMQVYAGLNKLWEEAGKVDTRSLEHELSRLENEYDDLTGSDFTEYAESVDDGLLQEAIEDASFDHLSMDW